MAAIRKKDGAAGRTTALLAEQKKGRREMNVTYTRNDEPFEGTPCFECGEIIDTAGDAVSVIQRAGHGVRPLSGFLHKTCAKDVGLGD